MLLGASKKPLTATFPVASEPSYAGRRVACSRWLAEVDRAIGHGPEWKRINPDRDLPAQRTSVRIGHGRFVADNVSPNFQGRIGNQTNKHP